MHDKKPTSTHEPTYTEFRGAFFVDCSCGGRYKASGFLTRAEAERWFNEEHAGKPEQATCKCDPSDICHANDCPQSNNYTPADTTTNLADEAVARAAATLADGLAEVIRRDERRLIAKHLRRKDTGYRGTPKLDCYSITLCNRTAQAWADEIEAM